MKNEQASRLVLIILGLLLLMSIHGCGNDDDNNAPIPKAPAIVTARSLPGTSQVDANDPDIGQPHTFAITTLPANGTAVINEEGLVVYTPNVGFTGRDSLIITVTDNGNPPLSGTVLIDITVTPLLADPNRFQVELYPTFKG
jgi:hypothetical protein